MADLLDLLKTDNLDSIGEDFDFADKGSSNSSFRKKSDQTQIGESRKKVVFKEHDDDPLAGLPDDDYFLQNSKNKGKTSFMDELLGMKSDADLNKDNQAVQEKSVMKATDQILEEDKLMDLKREPIKRQNSDNDSLKAAESSLSVKQKSINEKSKKSSLMRDLFGNSSPSKDPYRSSGKSSLENPSGKSIFSLDTVEQTSSLPSGYAPTISGSREPRRRRGSALATSDPLGLFLTSHDSEQNTDNQMQAKRVIRNPEVTKSIDHTTQPFLQASSEISTRDNLPEWLGGKGWNESNVMKKTDQAPKSEINVVEKTEKQEKLLVDDHLKTSMNKNENYPENLSILMSSQFEQQSAIIAMQQQEHELKTATVLSRQNDQLNNLLNDQKSILNQQEKQFSNLIKKQVERQALLETQMKAQQARIDQHIQTLMAQPMLTTHPGRRIQEHSDEHPQESESIIQKLQLEKSYLENTLESLRAKHEKEISILEESHSKQLSFLEETMEKLDKRMRYETEILEANYETKIEKLREEKQQMETMYKEDIENLKKSHAKFIDSIHEQHARSIELLRKEYLEVFEHISQMKHLEKEITSNITSHRTDIENMLDKTKTIIDSINTINEKLQDKHEQFTETKENILKRHEEYLEKQQQGLNKQNEIIKEDHLEIVRTLQTLDLQMKQLTSDFEDRMKVTKETDERLKKKEELLMWEREQFEEKIKLERNHFQTMKESWIKEQERQLKLIVEERGMLATDKAKLEVLSRLKLDNNDISKAEIEATLRAAEEAVKATNKEKHRWREKISKLEFQQQLIDEKENLLIKRAKELEDLTQSALAKQEEGLRALREAKRLEVHHKEKLKQFQTQVENLAQRESKIISEKLYLARDRLSSLTLQTEQPERDSKTNYSQNILNSSLTLPDVNSLPITRFKDIVDPHLVMLKINLDQKLDSTNEYIPSVYR